MSKTKIILATRNRHKVAEIQQILGPAFESVSLDAYPAAPPLIEDGDTFAANATRKAVQLANWLKVQNQAGAFVLADDSGLEVDALHGQPGVHSARFAALGTDRHGNSPDRDNTAKLLRLLASIPENQWTARFRCVLALARVPDHCATSASPACSMDESEFSIELFSGACEGRIVSEGKGAHGFGYDPVFVPNGYAMTFAELGEDIKNRISHRSQALELLKRYFQSP